MALWSAARIAWALTILIYKNGIEGLYEENHSGLSSLVMFLLLLFCEIIPIFILLDLSFLKIVGFQNLAAGDDLDSITDDELSQRLVTERITTRQNMEDETDSSVRGLETAENNWTKSTAAAQLYGEYNNTVKENPLVMEK